MTYEKSRGPSMNIFSWATSALVLAGVCPLPASAAQQSLDMPPVVIDYFYEAGCPDCFRVRDQVLPVLKERFEGFYTLNRHDISVESNVVMLVAYQEKLSIADNKPVCMVVDYGYAFNGFDAIKTGLFEQVDECVSKRMEPGWKPPEPIQEAAAGTDMAGRVRRFTLSAVIAAALIDGINPCAISTLVFFMSLLAVAKVTGQASRGSFAQARRGQGLLIMGASYCLASFVTYTVIGFGLLRVLYLFDGLPMVRFAVEAVMMVFLAVFAYLSFRDAWHYKASGNAEDVTLQLSDGMKMRMHGIMRRGLGVGSLALGGLVIGAAVTAIESVCTGQVYVPTLVLVIKTGKSASQAWSYLLLYNAMFIVPLVAVFVLTYFGLRTQTLLEWSKRNVVPSKILLGVFFLAMAALIGVI